MCDHSKRCRHCETAPAQSDDGLCGTCNKSGSLRSMYERSKQDTPAFLAKLDRLRQRGKQRLPLFVGFDTLPESRHTFPPSNQQEKAG